MPSCPLARRARRLLTGLLAVSLLGTASCDGSLVRRSFYFTSPAARLLSLASDQNPVRVELQLPRFGQIDSLALRLDGAPALADGDLVVTGDRATGSLGALEAGRHELEADLVLRVLVFFRISLRATTWLERVALDRPDDCEILNDIECVLPFPSSRFLVPASTRTGVRVEYPDGVLPNLPRPLDSAEFSGQDGFSPGVQVMMHFPGGVDPERSGASRLLAATRSHDRTSLRRASPTLLLDASNGMRPVPHWIEPDAHAAEAIDPEREVLFLRPAVTLKPGHRYVVAMRNLVHADGTPVEAEPVFAALRDQRPSDIPAVQQRVREAEELFGLLRRHRVDRSELVLAFDFVVQSDEDLTREMLAMRDRSFAWLAGQSQPTFTVFPFAAPGQDPDADVSIENDCSDPAEDTWREVRGRFDVPLFLSADPLLEPITGGRLVDDDGDGLPDPQGTLQAPYTISIPCAVLDPLAPPARPIVLGHGLFGEGRGMVSIPAALGARAGRPDFVRIAGATDWLGLSTHDFLFDNPFNNYIVRSVLIDADNFRTLPDRLRQGMTNTLVLARMMREGRFAADAAFRTPGGRSVFAGPDWPIDYYGISLGGIMGTLFAATSPDVAQLALDVPAANFSILIHRSGAISLISLALDLLNPDPMVQSIFLALAEEYWDSAEPSGYLRHVTSHPLPGSGAAKDLLYTVAEFDGIVSNEASEIAIRTLGLPNLHDAANGTGSSVAGRFGIRDVDAVSTSDRRFVGAAIWYDLAMYGDLSDPELASFAPPLSNSTAPSSCDPHGRTLATRAEARQIVAWLEDATITSTCDGLCDGLATAGGFEPSELPGDAGVPCDPRGGGSPFPGF